MQALTSPQHPVRILLAEDSEDDILIIQRAFRRGQISVDLQVVRDGQEVLDYLQQQGKFSQPEVAPRPDLLMLDINMPRKDGLTTLREIRADPRLRLLPVIILTTSRAQEDIVSSYESGANTYVTKPNQIDKYIEEMRLIDSYWRLVAVRPPLV
ncbi:response regulator [Leptolyngbya sp. FACHB-261]|uniref:response regulator n=1 Tax=Leptolyngbya sp. FACHB-261 TaxID=2692806 RepID=UPI0016830599|nr:response regulator [Leptolyngbya sp. FACHB-261]MBD2102286.1 response regulator [Leptolyngbya sp. FACHB-261]